jgi:hypothetical protein
MTPSRWIVALAFSLVPAAALAGGPSFDAKGKYYETCACAVSCPCGTNEFLPTEGHCDAMMTFHLDKASVGKVKMDGLNFTVVMKSPQNEKVSEAFEKGQMDHFAVYLDSRATDAQRAAFPQLLEGMVGKMEIKGANEPSFVPISLSSDGETAKIAVADGKLTADLVNIKIGETKHGGKTATKHIKLDGVVPFPWVNNVTQGKSNSFHYSDGTTQWDYKGRNAYFGDFSTKGTLASAAAPKT